MLSLAAFAQEGSVNAAFNQDHYKRFEQGSGLSDPNFGSVTRLYPDGKMMVGGQFSSYNGRPARNIARLHPDGSIDTTFKSLFNSGSVSCIAIQPDGKIVVGGSFSQYDGVTCNRIIRLNADGTVDQAFQIGSGPYSVDGSEHIFDVAITSGNKIIVMGSYSKFNGVSRKGLVRLNTDGSVDQTFGSATGGAVSSDGPGIQVMALQPDGAIIVGGFFTTYDGAQRKGIARVTPNGAVDGTFLPGNGILGYQSYIRSIYVQPDGSILVGGHFSGYSSNTNSPDLVRIHPDGTPDYTFNTGTGPGLTVTAIGMQSDEKIIVGGVFTTYNGAPASYIMRLFPDGSLDNTFNSGLTTSPDVNSITVQADDKILVRGAFVRYNALQKRGIVRLEANGDTDLYFAASSGPVASNQYYFIPGEICSVLKLPDGKKIVGGRFTEYNGIPISGVARINDDGTLDMGFNTGTGLQDPSQYFRVNAMALQADGKILVGGSFSTFNGQPAINILRLNADGSLDTDFATGNGYGTNGAISCLYVQPDGKILVGGEFTTYNGTGRNKIARLNADGTVDTGFQITSYTSPDAIVALQPDGNGNYYAAGGWVFFKFTSAGTIVFNKTASGTIRDLGVLPGGKIVVTGDFAGPKRYTATGLSDNTFNSPGIQGKMIKVLGNGKIYVGTSTNLYRLYSDGTADNAFSTGTAGNNSLSISSYIAGVLPEDNRLLVYGWFGSYNGAGYNSIVALESSDPAFHELQLSFTPTSAVGCQQPGSVTALAFDGVMPYSYAWQTNPAVNTATIEIQSPGVYTCTVTDAGGSARTASLLISGPQSTSAPELNANLHATAFRPGFASMVWPDAFNDGCIAVSGQLQLAFDPLLTFVSSDLPPSQNGNTLSWDYTDLAFGPGHIKPQLKFMTQTSASIGDSIHFTVTMTPAAGDFDPSNNTKQYAFPVVNGYDPNDKSVYPKGKCDSNYVKADDLLTYTVRFQNTGNSEAIHIAVADSIDQHLAAASLRVIGQSHPLWTEVLPGNVLKFHFDNIHLPDSASNEEESHGYVTFEARPVSTMLSHNTPIENRADIYFDFNPPVLTNVVTNHIYNTNLPLEEYVCYESLGLEEYPEQLMACYPNPVVSELTVAFENRSKNAEISVINSMGETIVVYRGIASGQQTIGLDGTAPGIYFVQLKDGSRTSRSKIVKNI